LLGPNLQISSCKIVLWNVELEVVLKRCLEDESLICSGDLNFTFQTFTANGKTVTNEFSSSIGDCWFLKSLKN
jgi:hypothetical protein